MQLQGLRWVSNSRPRESSATLCQLSHEGRSFIFRFVKQLGVGSTPFNSTMMMTSTRASTSTYVQSFGVFKSATTTSFQPWIFDSFCTCSVGEAIEVTTIHLSYVSPAGGFTFFSIFIQFTFSFNFPSFATACQWIAVSLWVAESHRPLRFDSAQELAAENQ